MRYLRIIIVIIFCIILFSSLTRAGDLYMWTDKDGVVHIADTPPKLLPGGGVKRIHNKDRGGADGQSLPDKGQDIETVTEEDKGEEAVSDRTRETSKEERRRRELEQKLGQAQEEYDLTRELVEKRRRLYVRYHTRANRARYQKALDELAEKREKLRDLIRQK